MPKEPSVTISFRLPASLAKKLEEQGGESGLSRGDLARSIVIDSLTDATTQQLLQRLEELRVGQEKADFNTRRIAKALLMGAARIPEADAQDFVETRLQH